MDPKTNLLFTEPLSFGVLSSSVVGLSLSIPSISNKVSEASTPLCRTLPDETAQSSGFEAGRAKTWTAFSVTEKYLSLMHQAQTQSFALCEDHLGKCS